MACLCCTCLNCTVVTFCCLAVFTVQTVVTVYLDFLPCFCAAALASGRLPGSNSMCTSMFRLGLQPAEDIRWSSPHPRLRFGAICKLAYVNVLSLSVTHFLLFFQADCFSSSLSVTIVHPYLEPAELLGWRDPHWKTSFVTSTLLSPLPPHSFPSLHGSSVRTEVKSCRAELPGHLPKTLLIRRPSFSTSPLSQSLFSRPPSHHCSGVQNVSCFCFSSPT